MPSFSATQLAYIRKRTRKPDLDPSEMAGELNIIPFLDIVMNLIIFLLATSQAVLAMVQIESELPKISRGRARGENVSTPLNLNVTVTERGVIVSGSGGKLAPGCKNTATGRVLTVPRKNNDYDWTSLTECVALVKTQFEDETTVTVSADPPIHYEYIVAAMDAVRNNDDKELFPEVLISVGVR